MTRPRTAPRSVHHPDLDAVALRQVLEALADPVRLALVSQLARSEGHISCGGFDVPVAASTLTHHCNVLREAGLIRQYYVGTVKRNALRAEEMEARFPGLLAALLAAATVESPAVAA
ncbi:ArsR/SmtB family transcription factor [Glycomyces harbinensis]|uniref:DNA-binding transcriptional regulator, ArsR family n=1 Tax=Glycomyces harbinensis TaxID=58114 RepID=A0A1G6UFB0_9ACTN|nr:helix-turn-helix transcriptional regulator [Glycomyces harbinensis]SDD39255.1 DNA-binding transcriptional regulator, ArsR family [Glycomyces harbinensis]